MLLSTVRLLVLMSLIAINAVVGRSQDLILRGPEEKEAAIVGLDVKQLNALGASGNWPEAGKLVDDAIARSSRPELLWSISGHIAMRSIRSPEHIDSGIARLCVLIDAWSSQPDLHAVATRDILAALDQVTNRWLRQNRSSEAIAIVEKTIQRAAKLGTKGEICRLAVSRQLATLLKRCNRDDEARTVLNVALRDLSTRLGESFSIRRQFALTAMALDMFEDEHSLAEQKKQTSRITQELILILDSDNRNVDDLTTYVDLKMNDLQRQLGNSIEEASAIALDMRHRLDIFSVEPGSRQFRTLEIKRKELSAMESRIQAARQRSALIGSFPPDFRAEYFIGMEPATLASLQGKVVLIDFFSMNCGPCIASFPALHRLHAQYAEYGLCIVGMTSLENFVWDEQTKSAILSVDVSHAAELDALTKFRQHHRLEHGIAVLADQQFQRSLLVEGVPQVVLLDRHGRIQFVHVGSSREAERELEEAIKRLTMTM
jgi:thiol-disulfide isomerase/thioredoxin